MSIFKKIRNYLEKKKESFNRISQQFFIEEVMNVLTHMPAIFAFSFFGGMLIAKTQFVISNLVYVLSLVNLFTFSVLYHAFQKRAYKKFFQLCDHISIYLLIGGTYTPILSYLNEQTSLVYIWVLIGFGILERLFFIHKIKNYINLFLTKCILAGVYILSLKSFYSIANLPFYLFLGGGLAYIGGSYFFVSTKKFAHAWWHVAVLAGSVCHFLAVYLLTK
mgnify:CR=1 FL=1